MIFTFYSYKMRWSCKTHGKGFFVRSICESMGRERFEVQYVLLRWVMVDNCTREKQDRQDRVLKWWNPAYEIWTSIWRQLDLYEQKPLWASVRQFGGIGSSIIRDKTCSLHYKNTTYVLSDHKYVFVEVLLLLQCKQGSSILRSRILFTQPLPCSADYNVTQFPPYCTSQITVIIHTGNCIENWTWMAQSTNHSQQGHLVCPKLLPKYGWK